VAPPAPVVWEVCPASIEHVPKIVKMRRNLVEMKAKFPEELPDLL